MCCDDWRKTCMDCDRHTKAVIMSNSNFESEKGELALI
jgi:hypothetical protein